MSGTSVEQIEAYPGTTRVDKRLEIGDTVIRLRESPEPILVGKWMVIDIGKLTCEVRQITAIKNRDVSVAALTYGHDQNAVIRYMNGNEPLSVEWWGASPFASAAANTAAIQAAIAGVDANGTILQFGNGIYHFLSAISVDSKYGIIFRGIGGLATNVTSNWDIAKGGATVLQFDGATSSFEMIDSRIITWEYLVINGNASAVHGLHFKLTTYDGPDYACWITFISTGSLPATGSLLKGLNDTAFCQYFVIRRSNIMRCIHRRQGHRRWT